MEESIEEWQDRTFEQYKKGLPQITVEVQDDEEPFTVKFDAIAKRVFFDAINIGLACGENKLNKTRSTFQKKINSSKKHETQLQDALTRRKEGQRITQRYIDTVLKPDLNKAIELLTKVWISPIQERIEVQKFLKERQERIAKAHREKEKRMSCICCPHYQCPNCGMPEMEPEGDGTEMVKCPMCRYVSDKYEAMKQYEKYHPKAYDHSKRFNDSRPKSSKRCWENCECDHSDSDCERLKCYCCGSIGKLFMSKYHLSDIWSDTKLSNMIDDDRPIKIIMGKHGLGMSSMSLDLSKIATNFIRITKLEPNKETDKEKFDRIMYLLEHANDIPRRSKSSPFISDMIKEGRL